MDIPIFTPSTSNPRTIVDTWGGRLNEMLTEHYLGRLKVDWTLDQDAYNQNPPAILQWFALRKGSRLMGHIRLAWNPNQPDSLQIRTDSRTLPEAPTPPDPGVPVLDWVAALAGLGAWLWFAILDWHRIWNRVSTFSGGYDAEHATKLEIYLLALGWALGPILAIVLLQILRAGFGALGRAWQRLILWAFAKRELDQVLEQLIQNHLRACREDIQACLALGQAHPGSPLPMHANLVWGRDGKYLPAEGYRWNSEDPDSLDVALED